MSSAASSFGSVQRLACALNECSAAEMDRRAEFAHCVVEEFAAVLFGDGLREPLEMAQRCAHHGDRGSFGDPQAFEREIEAAEIAFAGGIAHFFAAGFGFIAHDGADVFEFDALLVMGVEDQLVEFAPRDAAIRTQPRDRIVQRLGADGKIFGLQRACAPLRPDRARYRDSRRWRRRFPLR